MNSIMVIKQMYALVSNICAYFLMHIMYHLPGNLETYTVFIYRGREIGEEPKTCKLLKEALVHLNSAVVVCCKTAFSRPSKIDSKD